MVVSTDDDEGSITGERWAKAKRDLAAFLGVPRVENLTSRQVAEFLNVPSRRLDQWAKAERGPHFFKAENQRRYPVEKLLEWVAANSVETGETR